MRYGLAFLKLARCILHLIHGIWTILTRFKSATLEQRTQHISEWSRRFLAILNVKVSVQGHVEQRGPMLVVINHVSWLDILVMLSAQGVCFVSKSEVKHWPLIGWLATNVGTLYIERTSRRDAMRVVHQVADKLRSGGMVGVFPEGTTTDGASVLPFHGNLMQAAISVGCPVQPVALRYLEQSGQRSMRPIYIDDDTLLSSVWRMLCAAPITASLDFLPSMPTDGLDRRALAAQLQEMISSRLKI